MVFIQLLKVLKEDSIKNCSVTFSTWVENQVVRADVHRLTYEGDLMAKTGVTNIAGRESNRTYKETYNGVQLRDKHQFPDGIDP